MSSRSHSWRSTSPSNAASVSKELATNDRRPTFARRSGRLAAAAAFGEPALAIAATVVFGETAPNAGFLVGFEGVEQTLLKNRAGRANRGCLVDHVDGGTGRSDGEEDVWVGSSAGGKFAPVGHGQHGVRSSCTRVLLSKVKSFTIDPALSNDSEMFVRSPRRKCTNTDSYLPET